jgi:hypothetical protein
VLGVFFGPMSTALAEQFQTHVRSTGLGTAYNMAVMVFGGFAPFGAAAGLLAAVFLKERAAMPIWTAIR